MAAGGRFGRKHPAARVHAGCVLNVGFDGFDSTSGGGGRCGGGGGWSPVAGLNFEHKASESLGVTVPGGRHVAAGDPRRQASLVTAQQA